MRPVIWASVGKPAGWSRGTGGRTAGVGPVSQPSSRTDAAMRGGAEGMLGRGSGMGEYGVEGAAGPRTTAMRPEVVEGREAGVADIARGGCVGTGMRAAGAGAS